jgi:hypothetical protein
VQGLRSGSLIYDTNVVVSVTNYTFFRFNFTDIDRLKFISSGGQKAFSGLYADDGTHFVMDNFTFELVPEPSSLLLVVAGALLLAPVVRRRFRSRQ